MFQLFSSQKSWIWENIARPVTRSRSGSVLSLTQPPSSSRLVQPLNIYAKRIEILSGLPGGELRIEMEKVNSDQTLLSLCEYLPRLDQGGVEE